MMFTFSELYLKKFLLSCFLRIFEEFYIEHLYLMKNILGASFQFCIFYSSKRWDFFFLAKADAITYFILEMYDSNEGKMQAEDFF